MKARIATLFIFTILLLSTSFDVVAQHIKIDSLKAVLKAQKDDTSKVILLNTISYSYAFSFPDSGIMYAQRALQLAEKLSFEQGIFESEFSFITSLTTLGNYPLQLKHCFKALSLANKIKNPKNIAFANGMLSECYYNLGDYNISLNYEREVIKIVQKLYKNQIYYMWVQLSRIFDGMNKTDSAMVYAQKAYTIIRQNKNANDESLLFPILGSLYAKEGFYDKALSYYKMGVPLAAHYKFGTDLIDNYNGIANVYNAKGNLDSAAWFSKKILSANLGQLYPVGLLKAANMLAAIYQLQNKPDSTLKYLRAAITLKDSLFNREKTIVIQNLTYKEQEKQKDTEATEKELRGRFKLYLLFIGVITTIAIAGILVRNQRLKQLQGMRNSIADDLHDDIGSTLSSISIMCELAKKKSPEALALLNAIDERTNVLQENISDIVWAVNSKNDRFEDVIQRMNQFASEMLDPKNIELEFNCDVSLHSCLITMVQRKNLYLFFKEVINNAAKYSEAKKVSIFISKKEKYLEMSIRDNGKGFDTAEKLNGNGMATLKKRGVELNADFKLQSAIAEGTVVLLKFKLH